MGHDPLCLYYGELNEGDCTMCGVIATVRVDERERIAVELDDCVAAYPEDIWPQLEGDNADHATRPGIPPVSIDRIGAHAMRHAYRNAARIARGE